MRFTSFRIQTNIDFYGLNSLINDQITVSNQNESVLARNSVKHEAISEIDAVV